MSSANASPPLTLRVDIQHGGDAEKEHCALERAVVEPRQWAGSPSWRVDDTNRGAQKFEVAAAASGRVLNSRG